MALKKPSLSKKDNLKTALPRSSRDLPVTQGMLHLVKGELKADIRELRSEMNAQFHGIRSEFHSVRSDTERVQSEVHGLRNDVERVMQVVHRVASEVARVGVLMEEQNSRNQIVLEGLTGLIQRDNRIETRIDEVEKTIQAIGRSTV